MRTLRENITRGNAESPAVQDSSTVCDDPASTLRNYAESVIATSGIGAIAPQVLELPLRQADILQSPAPTSILETTSSEPISLEAKRDLARERRKRQSDLLKAAKTGDDIEVEILLATGAEVDWIDRQEGKEGKTALHVAAQYGQKHIAKLLLEHGADLEAQCEDSRTSPDDYYCAGRTPLHWAAAGVDTGDRKERTVRFLIEYRADITARSYSKRTPLHAAVKSARTGNDASPVVQLLLERGAMVNACDSSGWTPLHLAASECKMGIVQILLDHGAQVDGRPKASDPANATNPQVLEANRVTAPLLETRRCSYPTPTIELFYAYGADLYAKLVTGETMLHIGASLGKSAVLLVLLNAGMDINVRDTRYRDTALHKAAWGGKMNAAQILLERGADIHLKNSFGRNAIQNARSHGNEQVARLLEQYAKGPSTNQEQSSFNELPLGDKAQERTPENDCPPNQSSDNGDPGSQLAHAPGEGEWLQACYDEVTTNPRSSQITHTAKVLAPSPRSSQISYTAKAPDLPTLSKTKEVQRSYSW